MCSWISAGAEEVGQTRPDPGGTELGMPGEGEVAAVSLLQPPKKSRSALNQEL